MERSDVMQAVLEDLNNSLATGQHVPRVPLKRSPVYCVLMTPRQKAWA